MSIVFFDLDGTLVDEDGNIPPSAALAIRRLRENGHYCVVNTGRPFRDRDPALDALDFDGCVQLRAAPDLSGKDPAARRL